MEAAFEVNVLASTEERIEDGENPLQAKKETKTGIEENSIEDNRIKQNVDEKDGGEEINSEKNGDRKSGGKNNDEYRGKENIDNKYDTCRDLSMTLSLIKANLDQLAENCNSVNDRLKNLEMDSISLLQPLGDIISLERELKRLSEIESDYMRTLRK